MSNTSNYLNEAASDAADTVRNFEDEILDQLIDDGEASDDLLNDYGNGDAYHHESHVDKDYGLLEAATLLDQLDDYEETDSGLWEGLEPRRAIAAMAAYTYGNAVYGEWRGLIEKINSEAADILSNFADEASDLESEIDSLKDEAAEAEDEDDAQEFQDEAAQKQADLDSIDDRKREALSKMIAEVLENA
jgi:hypothetical protein